MGRGRQRAHPTCTTNGFAFRQDVQIHHVRFREWIFQLHKLVFVRYAISMFFNLSYRGTERSQRSIDRGAPIRHLKHDNKYCIASRV